MKSSLRRHPPRAAHAVGQTSHQIGHRLDARFRRLHVRTEALLEGIDQGGADHDAVGDPGDGACLRGRAHPEADRDRQRGVALDARDRGRRRDG
jgi:hypothetical protein